MNKLLVIGGVGGTNIAENFYQSAARFQLEARLLDTKQAQSHNKIVRGFAWRLLGHRPAKLNSFGRLVRSEVQSFSPNFLLTTGLAPLNRKTLEFISREGIISINYLSDDPWNPSHSANWFFEGLNSYHFVYSPRRSNIGDLKDFGCQHVEYLPFAYPESLCKTNRETTLYGESELSGIDVLFIGGGDDDRAPMMESLLDAGLSLRIFGGNWKKYSRLHSSLQGYADVTTMVRETLKAKVNICLVKKSNRDGHVMRSFEIPAIGGCILAEDTSEHREIFGGEGDAVLYFSNSQEMVKKCYLLTKDFQLRSCLANKAHRLIVSGRSTYADRLETMITVAKKLLASG